MGDLVRLSVEDGVGVITVENPPVNALSPGVPEGILDGVQRFGSDEQCHGDCPDRGRQDLHRRGRISRSLARSPPARGGVVRA